MSNTENALGHKGLTHSPFCKKTLLIKQQGFKSFVKLNEMCIFKHYRSLYNIYLHITY